MLYTEPINTSFHNVVTASQPSVDPFFNTSLLVTEVQWYYTDPRQQVQGPFGQDMMRVWNEEGYFSGDLPIRMNGWTRFYPFRQIFPDQRQAFFFIPKEPLPQPPPAPVLPSFGLGHIQIHHSGVSTLQQQPIATVEPVLTNQSTVLPLGVRNSNSLTATAGLGLDVSDKLGVTLAAVDLNAQTTSAPVAVSLTAEIAKVETPKPTQVVEEKQGKTDKPTSSSSISMSKSDIAKQLLGIKSKDTGVAAAAAMKTQPPTDTTSDSVVAATENKVKQPSTVQSNSNVPAKLEESNKTKSDDKPAKRTPTKPVEKSEVAATKTHKSSVTLHETAVDTVSSSATLHKIPLVEKIVKEQQQQQQQHQNVVAPKQSAQQQSVKVTSLSD